MKDRKEDITIIVNSCDAYSDVWFPFFELFRVQWPDCHYPIILNTESKSYVHPAPVAGGITCLQLFAPEENIDWSTRLIKTLEYVQTKYVCMFLEDEFIQRAVDVEGVRKVYSRMQYDPFISYVLFASCYGKSDGKRSKIYKDYNVIQRKSSTQNSANGAIWRLDKLKKYLKCGETPWQFEVYSKRRRGFLDRVYTYVEGKSPISVSYRISQGYGIVQGKWLWKNKELCLQNGITIDFERRGLISEEEVFTRMEVYRQSRKQEKLSFKEKIKQEMSLYKDCLPDKWLHVLSVLKNIVIK